MSARRAVSDAARGIRDAFDPRGRLSRSAYVRLILKVMLAAAVLFCLAVWIAGTGLRPLALAILTCGLLLWLATMVQTLRRLHDRNRTGWWLALALALYVGSFAPVDMAADAYPVPVALYALVTVVFLVWFVVETIGLRGTPGPNRYGPEPEAMPVPRSELADAPIERVPR